MNHMTLIRLGSLLTLAGAVALAGCSSSAEEVEGAEAHLEVPISEVPETHEQIVAKLRAQLSGERDVEVFEARIPNASQPTTDDVARVFGAQISAEVDPEHRPLASLPVYDGTVIFALGGGFSHGVYSDAIRYFTNRATTWRFYMWDYPPFQVVEGQPSQCNTPIGVVVGRTTEDHVIAIVNTTGRTCTDDEEQPARE